jgi:transposase
VVSTAQISMSNEQDGITPRDAASILGVHERTVQRLLKQGELPGYLVKAV